jgi:hypothetical protein
MPELAFSYLVGSLTVFLCVNWNLFLIFKKYQKNDFLNLNYNLEKVNKYWSINEGRITEFIPFINDQDKKKSIQSFFIFGTMLIFLSWAGFIVFWIYWFSLNKIAVSRQERILFNSKLVQEKLKSPEDVNSEINLLVLPE